MTNRKYISLPIYVWVAILIGLILRVWLLGQAPVLANQGELPAFNDELSHWHHVLWQRDTGGGTPKQSLLFVGEDELKTGGAEYWQPIYYYRGVATVIKAFPPAWGLYLARSLSIFFGFFALILLLQSVPHGRMQPPLAISGALLGAALPASLFVSNDTLMMLFIAYCYAFATSAATREQDWLSVVGSGAVMALGLYTKLPVVTVFPMVFAALWWNGGRRNFTRPLVAFTVVLLFAIPLALKRIELYGSILGLRHAGALSLRPLLAAIPYSLVSPWQETYPSLYVKLCGVALVICAVIASYRFIRQRRELLADLNDGERIALRLWTLGGTGAFAAWVYYAILNYQTEIRLMLPAAPVVAIYAGWWLWRGAKRERVLGWLAVLLMAAPYLGLLTM